MQEQPHASPRAVPAQVKTVLMVEDDEAIGEVFSEIIQSETPYHVIHVTDGEAGLKVVRTFIPQLVLLDYLLPDMNGLQCLEKLRECRGMEQTPVILMSAGLPEGVQMRGRVQARSDLVFLEKPFAIQTLLDLISHLLEASGT
jgi:DNA-binding response OmpR family regulator